jgi:hypothetical protein
MQAPPMFHYLVKLIALDETTEEQTVTMIDVLNAITEREAKRHGVTLAELERMVAQ